MLRLGILLMLLSFIPWMVLPAVPWLSSDNADRAKMVAGLILLGELLFWPGVALAGKEVWESAKAEGWRRVLPELLRRLTRTSPPTPGREPSSEEGKDSSSTGI